jgi:hypothetical protein
MVIARAGHVDEARVAQVSEADLDAVLADAIWQLIAAVSNPGEACPAAFTPAEPTGRHAHRDPHAMK